MANMDAPSVVFEASGQFGCFNRPETLVERFSYPVIPPSAARGLMDSIYVRPSCFRWEVFRVEILSPVKYISLKRNECKRIISRDLKPIDIGMENSARTQRSTMALLRPRYRIFARPVAYKGHQEETSMFVARFLDKVKRGAWHSHPYFGYREFVCDVGFCTSKKPVDFTYDLGYIPYDYFDLDESDMKKRFGKVRLSLFKAVVKNGVLEIPPYSSGDVIKDSVKEL